MNEDNSKNHQRSVLEQVPATQLLLKRYKCHEMHKLLDCLCQQLKTLEMMKSLNVLMIWRDEFNVIINVLNEKAITAFHRKYSSLQATAKSPSIYSQSLNQSWAPKKGSGLRISEIIDLTLDSNEDCTEIGVGNAAEKPSNSIKYFMSQDGAQSTATTAPPRSIQRSNHSSINQDMGEKHGFNGSGSTGLELTFQCAENQTDTANSNLRAPLDTQPLYSESQEISLQPISSSEIVPHSTKARRRGDPHQCNVCAKTFTRGTTLREHARSHTNEKPYKCNTCRKGFSRRKDCRRHELLHANTEGFHCSGNCEDSNDAFSWGADIDFGCGKSFARMDGLKAHWNSLKGAACLKDLFELEKRLWLATFEDKLCSISITGCDCDSQFESVNELKAHLDVPFQSSCIKESTIELAEICRTNRDIRGGRAKSRVGSTGEK